MEKQRDQLVDVLKGIGIISVVIGHSGALLPGMENVPSIVFVYLYHLMVFFFAAGMVFHPEKHPDPYLHIGKTIGSMMPLYIGYNLCFTLLHNFLIWAQLIEGSVYSLGQTAVNCLTVVTLDYIEPMVGALWFVPMFLLGKSLFELGFHYAEKCRCKWLAHTVIILATGCLAVVLNTEKIYLRHRLQTALLGIPVLYMGYLFSHYRNKLTFVKRPATLVISFLLMCLFISRNIGYIELSQNYIISPLWFYPITMLGMVFCLSLGETILRSKRLTSAVSYMGRISFHVMAIHFFVFKVFDWVYCHLMGVEATRMMLFPTAYTNVGLVYTVVGIAGSVIFVKLLTFVKGFVRSRILPVIAVSKQ